MAWTYGDYRDYDDLTERLARLRKHAQEVADALTNPASHNIDGMGYTMHTLKDYLTLVETRLDELEAKLGRGAQGTPFTMVRGRPTQW